MQFNAHLDLQQVLPGRLRHAEDGTYSRCFEFGDVLHVDSLSGPSRDGGEKEMA
jgi:hypothetical protein